MDFAGKRITVMGLGRFGGGVGVARWLCAQGADVLVTDTDTPDKLTDSLAAIHPLIDSGQISLRLGEHNVSDFTTCDLVVANVAVPKPWENRFLRAAEAARIPVATEISLLIDHLPAHTRARTIAVTGSAGKSTTTAMIHHALTAALRPTGAQVLLGGNIGGSLLGELDRIDERTWLVLELSSAMLYWLERTGEGTRRWSPHIAVATNLSPNHIDWHGDLTHYRAAKQSLIRHQSPRDTVILGDSIWDWRELTAAATARIDPATFSLPMKLPGDHNRTNAAAAALACRAAIPTADPSIIDRAIADFAGLAHRLQLVAEVQLAPGEPLRFYNDSKSTTPESCLKALEALGDLPGFSTSRIHLIAGGYDKGSDLTPIAAAAARLARLYTIGKTGPALAAAAGERAAECGTLELAFDTALAAMRPGDALLLSPGCASWDQFVNFEQRGERFVKLVEGLVN